MKLGFALVLILAAAACGPDKSKGPQGPGSGTGTGTDTVEAAPPDADLTSVLDEGPMGKKDKQHPAVPARAAMDPEVFAPAWKVVGVGQRIWFSTAAIDQNLDETRTEVTSMPESASFDSITQTISWKPTKKDLAAKKGTFVVKVSNLAADGTPTQSWDHTWEIAVAKKKQKAPAPIRLGAAEETVLTIREPGRLAAVNKAWPFEKMLLRAAELQRAQLPPEAQAKLGKLDKQALYTSFLAGLAVTHANPWVDPSDPKFAKDVFGDSKKWKIVAVRNRLDKKWNELRIVYQLQDAPEPVFAMFRLRPTWDVPTLPPEARAYNNQVFEDLVWRHLLVDGKPNEKFLKDEKKHGKAVAALVDELLAYDDSANNPWARAAFLALPTEARLGGGSRRNDDGSYRSGDGWAWSVMGKPNPNADGTNEAYVNIPIPGFFTQVVASPDGKAWAGACSPRFHPYDPMHTPGSEGLCRKDKGFVDLPDVDADGKVVSGKRDAVMDHLDYKTTYSVEYLALEDPRRDAGEENGMTCSQCHIRNFGVRDYADAATVDPSAGLPAGPNAGIATLNFQIVPDADWSQFMKDFMKDQSCKAAANFEKFYGKPSGFVCELKP